jgi:hypothetical protein
LIHIDELFKEFGTEFATLQRWSSLLSKAIDVPKLAAVGCKFYVHDLNGSSVHHLRLESWRGKTVAH